MMPDITMKQMADLGLGVMTEEDFAAAKDAWVSLTKSDVENLYTAIRRMAIYFHSNVLSFQYEKMVDYVRELELLLPEGAQPLPDSEYDKHVSDVIKKQYPGFGNTLYSSVITDDTDKQEGFV